MPNLPKKMFLRAYEYGYRRYKATWRAHSGYATYVLGLSSTIFKMPEGRRNATCVLGRICECMMLTGLAALVRNHQIMCDS